MCKTNSANPFGRAVIGTALGIAVLGLVGPAALAEINLDWRADEGSVAAGDVIEVDLYAVHAPSPPFFGPGIQMMRVLIEWDPDALELIGNVDTGPYDWMTSDFPDDPYGLNDSFQDGDAMYMAISQVMPDPGPAQATTDGLLVTTMQFEVVTPMGGETVLHVAADISGLPSRVYTSAQASTDVLGSVDSITFEIAGAALLGDMNCDGGLNGFDIDPFLKALTEPAVYEAMFPECDIMAADANGDGLLNAFDVDPFVQLLTSAD